MTERSMARRLVRWALSAALAVVIAGGLFIAFVAFPVPMFPHHRGYEGFSVYADREITTEVGSAVADAARRAAASELYRSGASYRVFLAHSLKRYAFFCSITHGSPESQALVFSWLGSMIVSEPGVRGMRERTGGAPRHSRLEGTLAGAIAHEVAHLQVAAVVGHGSAEPLPQWKSEGWADYAANLAVARDDPGYDLVARAELLLNDDAWRPPLRPVDRRHFRWHVLVEYLATARGLSFAEIVDGGVTEEQTWSDLRGWLARVTGPPGPRTVT